MIKKELQQIQQLESKKQTLKDKISKTEKISEDTKVCFVSYS